MSQYRFLERKPVVEAGKVINSKARSWVATLQDGRFPEEREQQEAVQYLLVALANSTARNAKGAITNIEKLFIGTCASSTQLFMTLFKHDQKHAVKRLLETLLQPPFEEHVLERALGTIHMMNDRDESTIQAWHMVGEFEDEEQDCTDQATHKDNLHRYQGTVLKYMGAGARAHVESQLSTATNQIDELEKQLADLRLQRDAHNFTQQINECSDPKEKQWLEAEFAAMSDIPDDIKETHEALDRLRFHERDMRDRFNLYIAVVVNFKPDAVLYKVDFMSETEREELIKDRLSLTLKCDAKTYVAIKEDPAKQAEATQLQDRIEHEVVSTHYGLMQDGLLPNFEKDHRLNGKFIERTQNVAKHLLDGEVSDKKEYKSKVQQMKGGEQEFICSAEGCNKKCKNVHFYRVKETGICYPISALADEKAKKSSILVFCSYRCEEKWDETLMCPRCKTFDWKRDEKGIAPYPDPFKLLDNFAQYDYCRRYLENYPVCPITREEPRMIKLPLCTTCSCAMMPRTPEAPHLTLCFSYDD